MAFIQDLGADHRRGAITVTSIDGKTAVVGPTEAKSSVTAPPEVASSSGLPIGKLLLVAGVLGVGIFAYRKWRK